MLCTAGERMYDNYIDNPNIRVGSSSGSFLQKWEKSHGEYPWGQITKNNRE